MTKKKQKVLIFGITDLARILYHFLQKDSDYEVCAFVVNKKYMPSEKKLFDKPILEFEKAKNEFLPDEYSIFLCVGYNNMNESRKRIYCELKGLGYKIESFIHKDAKIYGSEIGEGNIFLSGVTIDSFTKIGNGNIFFTDALCSHNSSVGNFNFFAVKSCVAGHVQIKDNCFLGANSTIKNGVNIDSYTLIGANAYISKDTSMYDVIVPERSILLDKKKSIEMNIFVNKQNETKLNTKEEINMPETRTHVERVILLSDYKISQFVA